MSWNQCNEMILSDSDDLINLMTVTCPNSSFAEGADDVIADFFKQIDSYETKKMWVSQYA